MKKNLLFGALALMTGSLLAAAPKDDVATAVKKIADAANYTWTTTMQMPGSPFTPGPTGGKAEKGGATVITRTFGDNTMQTVIKGEKTVMQNRDGVWVTREEMMQQMGGGGGGGGGRGMGMFGGAGILPAQEAGNLLAKLKELKVVDGVISGDLAVEDVTPLLSFGGRGGQGGQPATPPPAPKNAMGSVKFWLKDGALAKYEVHVKGTTTGRDGQEREVDRTTTTEFKDVGTTKVEIPEEAKKKL
jgi:hypothetical protein